MSQQQTQQKHWRDYFATSVNAQELENSSRRLRLYEAQYPLQRIGGGMVGQRRSESNSNGLTGLLDRSCSEHTSATHAGTPSSFLLPTESFGKVINKQNGKEARKIISLSDKENGQQRLAPAGISNAVQYPNFNLVSQICPLRNLPKKEPFSQSGLPNSQAAQHFGFSNRSEFLSDDESDEVRRFIVADSAKIVKTETVSAQTRQTPLRFPLLVKQHRFSCFNTIIAKPVQKNFVFQRKKSVQNRDKKQSCIATPSHPLILAAAQSKNSSSCESLKLLHTQQSSAKGLSAAEIKIYRNRRHRIHSEHCHYSDLQKIPEKGTFDVKQALGEKCRNSYDQQQQAQKQVRDQLFGMNLLELLTQALSDKERNNNSQNKCEEDFKRTIDCEFEKLATLTTKNTQARSHLLKIQEQLQKLRGCSVGIMGSRALLM